ASPVFRSAKPSATESTAHGLRRPRSGGTRHSEGERTAPPSRLGRAMADPHPGPAYRRVLLKLSGAALAGHLGYGIDPDTLGRIAEEVCGVVALGVQVAVVIGGGNIFRGIAASAGGMDRATGDYMGMLATVINALALQDAIEKAGVPTRVLSAIEMR